MVQILPQTQVVIEEEKNYFDQSLVIFGCLWAIFTVFHMESFIRRYHSFDDFILIVAAVYYLSRPYSLRSFIALVAVQGYVILVSMPFVSNHWLLAGFVDLTIITSFLFLVWKNKSFRVSKSELYATFAPVARVLLLVLYFYVVFHKLNYDFLTPGSSCASFFYEAQSQLSLLPSSKTLATFNIYFTLIVETLIPVLLFFRRTVLLGLFLGVIFHAVIAYNPLQPFYDFSSCVYALYILFIPYSLVRRVFESWKQTRVYAAVQQVKKLHYSRRNLTIVLAFIAVIFGIVFVLNIVFEHFFRYILWTTYAGIYTLFAATAIVLHYKKPAQFYHSFTPRYAFLWIIPVLVLLNGASPYLGLKTDSSFAMFSNLRTEGGISNHLIVPAGIQLFNFQKDMIEIKRSTDPALQRLADEQKLITYFELRRHIGSNKPAAITFIRQGKEVEISNTATAPEFRKALPFWQKRILHFRLINKYPPQPCAH